VAINDDVPWDRFAGQAIPSFMLTPKKLPGDRFDYIDFLPPGGSRHYPMIR
jgi:hypothetical protein